MGAPIKQTIKTSNPVTPNSTTGLRVEATSEKADGDYKYIYAEVKNTGQRREGVLLTATLYDANDKVIGTSIGAIQNIETDETKTATFILNDPIERAYVRFKVDIDSAG